MFQPRTVIILMNATKRLHQHINLLNYIFYTNTYVIRTLSVTEWHSYEWKMSAYYETSLACICLGQYSLTVIFITVDIQVSCLSIITNGQLKIIGKTHCIGT